MFHCDCKKPSLRSNSHPLIIIHEQPTLPKNCSLCGFPIKEAVSDKTIEIPKSSFTAFRFCYASAEEISVLARTTLVGGIPDAWVKLIQSSEHSDSTFTKKHRKSFFRKNFSRASIRQFTSLLDNSSYNTGLQVANESGMKQLYRKLLRPDVMHRSILNRFKYDQDILLQEILRQFNGNESSDSSSSNDSIVSNSCQSSLKNYNDTIASAEYSVIDLETMLLSSNCIALESTSSLVDYVPQYTNPNSPSKNVKVHDNSEALVSGFSAGRPCKSSECRKTTKATQVCKENSRIQWAKERAGTERKSKKLKFVLPEPECEKTQQLLRNELIQHEKLNLKMTRKFKELRQKKLERKRKRRLRVHLIDRIKMFAEGEIVRLDRMLVLVKQAPRIFNLKGFNEFSEINTVIEERWHEYFVVLRRGQDDGNLLIAQLYKTGKGRDFRKPPQFSFQILREISVDFFSFTDKSISVVQPIDIGTRIYIMNARYYSLSVKWIYLIKGCLDEQFPLLVNIHAGTTGQTFKINLLSAFLREAIQPSDKVSIRQEVTGYKIYEDFLFQKVFRKVSSRFNQTFSSTKGQRPEINRLNFWLACRFNRRAEWISNNSLSLLVLSHLFAKTAPLELIKMPADKRIQKFSTVEGFLVQATKKTEKQSSSLKFNKFLYVFVSKNLLFISKLNNAVPPSPQNELLRSKIDRAEIASTIPEVFEYNLFSLDSNGHIPWLDSPTFFRNDRQALEEFSRKVKQAAKADSVIDLCFIKEVRAMKKFELTARTEPFVTRFSRDLNEDITNSAFEIEFLNSSVMRLLAPSKLSRDKWVAELKESVLFWRKHQRNEVASMLQIKESNQRRARTNDSLDLMYLFESSGTIEETREELMPHNLAASVLSMSSVVLCSGELFFRKKKRELFSKRFAILFPGYLILYSPVKRSKLRSGQTRLPIYERQSTIPLSDCYIHTEHSAQYNEIEEWTLKSPGQDLLPRLFPDGWKSTTENSKLRFTLWYGRKRKLSRSPRRKDKGKRSEENMKLNEVIKALRIRGKAFIFQARSRYELEMWVHGILEELNRFAYE